MNTNYGNNFGRSGKGKTAMRRRATGADDAPESNALAHPGLAARVAAAAILCDIVQGGHTLDEKFASDAAPSRLAGLEARDRGLARSIVTVGVAPPRNDPPRPKPIDRERASRAIAACSNGS